MSQLALNYGSAPNDGTGASLYTLFGNAQANFTELYNGLGGLNTKSGASASTTSATEVALATIAIPANAIGANGLIRVTAFWEMTSSANQKNMRIRLGTTGIAGDLVSTVAATTIANADIEAKIRALNSTSSQKTSTTAPRGTDYLMTQGGPALASTINMTAAQNIVISGYVAGGETLTLLGYAVQFIK